MEKDTVIVTGFGPFGEHKINASWEAVKIIPSKNEENIELIIEEIPVTYTDVEHRIENLWFLHKPKLVIHVGLYSMAELIMIESKANRCGYIKTDCKGALHPTGEACPKNKGANTIHCQIDVETVCREVNETHGKIITCVSKDAGRYLCEYIFYKSLNMDDKRTMFVHVPPLNKPFSADELADAILLIIKACMAQINCVCTDN